MTIPAYLEGLNALLDHRASVFLPALGRTFACPPSFRIFAAQNPLAQGGGRKGLPHSFTNRFTRVRVAGLSLKDMEHIVGRMYGAPVGAPEGDAAAHAAHISRATIHSMLRFNQACCRLTAGLGSSASVLAELALDVPPGAPAAAPAAAAGAAESKTAGEGEPTFAPIAAGPVGLLGAPWDFNLRDVFRWCELCRAHGNALPPSAFVRTVYASRMRSRADSDALIELFRRVFARGGSGSETSIPVRTVTPRTACDCATIGQWPQCRRAVSARVPRSEPSTSTVLRPPNVRQAGSCAASAGPNLTPLRDLSQL